MTRVNDEWNFISLYGADIIHGFKRQLQMIIPFFDMYSCEQIDNLEHYGAVEWLVILPLVLLLVAFDPCHHTCLCLILLDIQSWI